MTTGVSRSSEPTELEDRRLRILFLNWRDTGHVEGGGSELYCEQVSAGLAGLGHDVTMFTALYPGAQRSEMTPAGVRIVRRGNHQSVYFWAAAMYRRGRLGRPDVIVETHNGMPFLARLWAARHVPVIVLVHHVHREQWRVVLGPIRARIGWWLESTLAPRVNVRCRYVAVSEVTRTELGELGVHAARVQVVYNGSPTSGIGPVAKNVSPSLLVVGRLVPHKRIEFAIDAIARLRHEFPDVTLTIVGRGWWEPQLRAYADRRGLSDRVRFTGFVSEQERHRLYGQSWVCLVPSLKEGWGLVVVEAAMHRTPTVAFQGAGGVAESILDGTTGLLADDDDVPDFTAKVRRLLVDGSLRDQLGADAAIYASGFTWDATVKAFDQLLIETVAAHSAGASRVGPDR